MHASALDFPSQNFGKAAGRIEACIVILTIAGYPIVAAMSDLVGIENRLLSILMRGALLAISLFLIVRFIATPIYRQTCTFWFAWWCFWALYLSRLVLDEFLNPDALKLPFSEYAIFVIGTCLIPGSAAALGNVSAGAKRALSVLAPLMVIGLILNYLVFFRQIGTTSISLESLRVETETLNPIAIGHLGVSILLLSLWKVNSDKQASLVKRFLLLFFGLVAVIAITSSGSRGPVFAFACALALYAAMLPRHFFSRISIFFCFVFAVVLAFNLNYLMSTFLFERLTDQLFQDDIRSTLLNGAFEIIKSHPFVGGGIEPLETYPHNLVIESFMVFGVFTGILFCYLLSFTFARIRMIALNKPSDFWVCILFTQYFVGAMVSGSIYTSNIFWVLMGLTVSLSARHSYRYASPHESITVHILKKTHSDHNPRIH